MTDSLTLAVRRYNADNQKNHIKRKLTAGLCGWSGCRMLKIGFYCSTHRRTKNKIQRKRMWRIRDARAAEHLCIYCGDKNDRPKGTRSCTTCLEIRNLKRMYSRSVRMETDSILKSYTPGYKAFSGREA